MSQRHNVLVFNKNKVGRNRRRSRNLNDYRLVNWYQSQVCNKRGWENRWSPRHSALSYVFPTPLGVSSEPYAYIYGFLVSQQFKLTYKPSQKSHIFTTNIVNVTHSITYNGYWRKILKRKNCVCWEEFRLFLCLKVKATKKYHWYL